MLLIFVFLIYFKFLWIFQGEASAPSSPAAYAHEHGSNDTNRIMTDCHFNSQINIVVEDENEKLFSSFYADM